MLNGEVIFDKFKFLDGRFAPRPYVGGQVNLAKETSWGGAGVLWRQSFGEKFYGDFGFGLVVHNGSLEENFNGDLVTPGGPIDLDALSEEQRLAVFDALFQDIFRRRRDTREYGSRVLFKESLTLGMRVNEDWAAEAYFEHVSHGGLLSDGSNDGSDSAGFRVARRF